MTMHALLFLKSRDVVDVLVISFLVHRLLLLFRGTTTLQIVVALSSLWVIYGVAQAAGLALTSWFLENMGTVMMFVIVVVFRNEIREVLIETSPVRLFLGRPAPTKVLERRAMA